MLALLLAACLHAPTYAPPPGTERDATLERTLRAALPEAAADARWVNRLVLETSPYLRQHATNPVDWRPWGDEASALAAATDRPILLSIGYSTCHWCHVMAHESFEDEAIAMQINQRFVPVKVDREERPDLDAVYMAAVQAWTRGHGGWPMTLVLAPDGQVLFAATYLPARDGDRGARRGFSSILDEVADRWRDDRAGLLLGAEQLTQHLRAAAEPRPPSGVPDGTALTGATEQLLAAVDPVNGGFGGAPKFPQPPLLDFLLVSSDRTGDPVPRNAVVAALDAMDRGGIHDHVGGGFHRYTVDGAWRVPHFEKMLYDNAQLLRTTTAAWQATGDERFARLAHELARYLLDEMRGPQGGFYSATDADSLDPDGHSEEGRFFTWTADEVRAALPPDDATWVIDHFAADEPNLDGRAVLYRRRAVADADLERTDAALRALETRRAKRPPPHLDDKVVTAWNGLAISALARAGWALDTPEYITAASVAADFLLDHARDDDGRLHRTWAGGAAKERGMLEDHSQLAEGLLDLFDATADPARIQQAESLMRLVDLHFRDTSGAWYRTPDDGETLLVRPRPERDGSEPSGASVGASVLLRLSNLTGDPSWETRADEVLSGYGVAIREQPSSLPSMLTVLDHRLSRSLQVVVLWPEGADPTALLDATRRSFAPHAELVASRTDQTAPIAARVPWAADKEALDGPTAWVCRREICLAPTRDAAVLRAALTDFGAAFATVSP